MADEIVLWRLRIQAFVHSLGRSTSERFLIASFALASLVGLATLFYGIGQYAENDTPGIRWVSIGLAFTFCAGFVTHLRPMSMYRALPFLPVHPKTVTWNSISAGLRFPLVVGFVVLLPYFIGNNQDWFYTAADGVTTACGLLAVLVAGYVSAVAAALAIRSLTRHTFIRLLAIIATLILVFEFLTGGSQVTAVIEQTLAGADRFATLLLAIASIGLTGVAVALIELCQPLPIDQPRLKYWGILHNNRNYRAVYEQAEAGMVRTILGFLRNPSLHLRLVLLLLFSVTLQAILVGAIPQYPTLQIALLGITLGLASFILPFSQGRASVMFENRLFFAPVDNRRNAIGSYLGSIVVFGLFAALFAANNPLGPLTTIVVTALTGTLGFWFGRREAQSATLNSTTWLIVLVALPTIFVVVTGSLIDIAPPGYYLATLAGWSVAYLVLLNVLGRQPRTDLVSAIQ